jgi:hypothetical protein
MAKVKNMGTATMKFSEGLIVTGSYNSAALTVSGSLKIGGDANNFSFPTEDGSSNQVLKTDGNGNLSWTAQSGGGSSDSITDADSNTKIQVEESSDENKIRFDTAGSERMIITEAGAVGIGTTTPAEKIDVVGSGKFSTSIKTPLIEYTDGDDAITIEDGGYLKFHAGVKYSRGVKVSSSNSADTENAWIKIASATSGNRTADTTASSLLITFAGHETSTNRKQDGIFIVTIKATYGSSAMDSDGTRIIVEPLNADFLSSSTTSNFNPASDIFITHDGSSDTNIDLYMKSPAKDKDCFVTHLGGTGVVDTGDIDTGFVIQSGESWAASEPAGLGNKTYGQWASKIFSKLGIVTNDPIAELDVAGKIAITAESSTPSQPSDGQGYLYTKSDGKVYWRSYDIAEVDLTAGGGGASGKVLQVVHKNFTGKFSTSSTSYVSVTADSDTLEVSITPSSSSSRVLIQVSLSIGVVNGGVALVQLHNESDAAVGGGVHDNSTNPNQESGCIMVSRTNWHNSSYMRFANYATMVLDSPATTNQKTYTIKLKNADSNKTTYVNRNSRYGNYDYDTPGASTITLIEIGA